jgi:hypothetical protein
VCGWRNQSYTGPVSVCILKKRLPRADGDSRRSMCVCPKIKTLSNKSTERNRELRNNFRQPEGRKVRFALVGLGTVGGRVVERRRGGRKT